LQKTSSFCHPPIVTTLHRVGVVVISIAQKHGKVNIFLRDFFLFFVEYTQIPWRHLDKTAKMWYDKLNDYE
jgi:hypothetical protein